MFNNVWLTAHTLLLPLLAGLFLLSLLRCLLSFWQQERSTAAASFALVQLGLLVLFLMYSLYARLSPPPIYIRVTTITYLLLSMALLVSNWCEWRALLAHLRRKDDEYQEPESENVVTLKDAATTDVALEATGKEGEDAVQG